MDTTVVAIYVVCGVKVHMIVTSDGKPVEFEIKPASNSDLMFCGEWR